MDGRAGQGMLMPLPAPSRSCSEAVVGALSSLPHGFDQLDRALIVHAALVSAAEVPFHRAWLQAVQVRPSHGLVHWPGPWGVGPRGGAHTGPG